MSGRFEPLIDPLDGKTHDIEIGAVHGGDAHVTNPLLYTISPRFVEGLIVFYVVVDLLVGERAERDIGAIDDSIRLLTFAQEGDSRIYLVSLAGEGAEHQACIMLVVRLAQHTSTEPDDGICRDKQVVIAETARVRLRLRARYKGRYIPCLQVSRVGLVGINRYGIKGQVKPRHQFATAGRL